MTRIDTGARAAAAMERGRLSRAAQAVRAGKAGLAGPAAALLAGWLVAAAPAGAQTTATLAPPSNVLNVSSEATAEVVQDLLSITLQAVREGADAATVQSQLRQAIDAALTEARRAARPGQLDVRTGGFTLVPRYAPRGGTITGWQGHAEVVLEGRDVAAISALAGRLPGLTVQRVGFGLSREARERIEAEVAAEAIARFRARAGAYAQQFGFGGWAVRDVTVGGAQVAQPGPPVMMRMRAAAAAPADEAQPVEAGRATVTVTVQGSVQMSAR